MHQALTSACLEKAVRWLRESPIRRPDGGYQSVFDPAAGGRYGSWGGGRTCLLTTAGSVLVFLALDDIEQAQPSAEHIMSLVIDEPGRFRGAIAAGEGSRYVYPYYIGFAIRALIAMHEATGDASYLDAAQRAGHWVIEQAMQPRGSIRELLVANHATLRDRFADNAPTWQAVFVDTFMRLAALTGQARFHEAAERLLAWLLPRQQADGSFAACERPWINRLARAAYAADWSRLTEDGRVQHPTGNVAAWEALLASGRSAQAERVSAWLRGRLGPHHLFYQYEFGQGRHSVEEDVMPTAFFGLLLLRAAPADAPEVCWRMAEGIRGAQVDAPDPRCDGGILGLPLHPVEGRSVYCWDTQYSILLLRALHNGMEIT